METNIAADEPLHAAGAPIEAKLGLWDAVSIIVGIIIGVGIFETPHDIFGAVSHPAYAIGLWILGGALALVGALCFAELASAYPRSGGEYVYLTRAFGPLTGYLFAWSQLAVTRSGSIASMAYIFGKSAASMFDLDDKSIFLLAGLSVAILTIVNILGVRMGTRTQNVLTIAKVVGLGALILVGFGWGNVDSTVLRVPSAVTNVGFISAMAFVLWTYAGWHEAAYVVAEAKNHTRNIPLALILGTMIVTVIYVLVNLALLYGLGFEGARHPNATVNLVELAWPSYGALAMNVLIMVSSLGAINGMIFTTARIYSEFGVDHRIFKTMSHWSRRWKTPARALAVQSVICLLMITGVWFAPTVTNSVTPTTRAIDEAARAGELFNVTVKLTVAVFWTFFCLTGVSLIVLRERDPGTPRPFRVPGYPILPIIFAGWCAYIVAKTIIDDFYSGSIESLVGLGVLFLGLPFYFLPQKVKPKQHVEDLQALSK